MTFIQKQVLAHIRDCLGRDGRSPTLADIGRKFHLSPTTIHRHVSELVDAGKLVRLSNHANGLSLPSHGYFEPTPEGRPWVREMKHGG